MKTSSTTISNTFLPLILAIFLGAVISILSVLHFKEDVPYEYLTRDPNAIAISPVYTGFLSQLGLFFWAASATTCIICFSLFKRKGILPGFTWFFGFAAILLNRTGSYWILLNPTESY